MPKEACLRIGKKKQKLEKGKEFIIYSQIFIITKILFNAIKNLRFQHLLQSDICFMIREWEREKERDTETERKKEKQIFGKYINIVLGIKYCNYDMTLAVIFVFQIFNIIFKTLC